jgi:hypothetical protein
MIYTAKQIVRPQFVKWCQWVHTLKAQLYSSQRTGVVLIGFRVSSQPFKQLVFKNLHYLPIEWKRANGSATSYWSVVSCITDKWTMSNVLSARNSASAIDTDLSINYFLIPLSFLKKAKVGLWGHRVVCFSVCESLPRKLLSAWSNVYETWHACHDTWANVMNASRQYVCLYM